MDEGDRLVLAGVTLDINQPLPDAVFLNLELRRPISLTIRDGGSITEFQTSAPTLGEALAEENVEIYAADEIEPEVETLLDAAMTVTITRSRSVQLAMGGSTFDIRTAAVRRTGSDVTLITYGGSLPKTLQAADRLAQDGVAAEVIDLRCLRPLDMTTVLASVALTHRAVIVDEGWKSGSLAAEVSARIMEEAFYELDAPVARVCSAEVPIPYAGHLEDAALPQVESIVNAVREMTVRHA